MTRTVLHTKPLGFALFVRAATLALPALVFLLVYAVHAPNEPLLNPDSDNYLHYFAIRSGGYPFFLAVLKPFIRDVADYAIAQRLLYALSVLVLGWQLLLASRSLLVCLALECLLLGNPEVNKYHFAIFTESVFLSTCALFLAAAVAHLRSGSRASLVAAAVLAGYGLAIRPTGLALVAAVPVLWLAGPGLSRGSAARRIIPAVLALAAVIAAERIVHRALHPGGGDDAMLATQLIGKAGMTTVPDPARVIAEASPLARPLQQALENELAPVRRLAAMAPSLAARCRIAANYETFVEYRFAPSEREALTAAAGERGVITAAYERLRHGIPDYIRGSAVNLYCLWTVWAASNREKAEFAAYLHENEPLPFAGAIDLATAPSPPFAAVIRIALLGCAVVLAGAAIALLITLCLRRRPDPDLALAGLCAIMAHVGMLLSACGSVAIPRYTLGLWVPLALGSAMALLWLVRIAGHAVFPPAVAARMSIAQEAADPP